MKSCVAAWLVVAMALAGCASKKITDPRFGASEGSGFLTILSTAPGFTHSPSYPDESMAVIATIHNNTDRTFYARVGDAYNSAEEQEQLCACEGSDGTVEKWIASRVWSPVRTAVAIEGVKVIVIRGGMTYQLIGDVPPHSSGTYRMRLDYSDRPAGEPDRQTYRDFSNAFLIR